MRKLFLFVPLIAFQFSFAQDRRVMDSLEYELAHQKEDTIKMKILDRLCWSFIFSKPDTSKRYGQQLLSLGRKLNSKFGINEGDVFAWSPEFIEGNYYRAIEILLTQMHAAEEANDMQKVANCYNGLFNCYRDMGDHQNALKSVLRHKKIYDSLGIISSGANTNLGNAYAILNQLDSALIYANKGYEIEYVINRKTWTWPAYVLGLVHAKLHNYDLALAYYRQGIVMSKQNNVFKDVVDNDNGIAAIYKEKVQWDSVIFYSRDALNYYNIVYYPKGAMEAAANLTEAYRSKNIQDSLLKYFEFSSVLKDSLYSQQKTMQVQNLAFTEQERQKAIDERRIKEKAERKHNLQYALIGIGLISFLVLFFLLSQSIIVRTGFIKFLGIVALLLVFEFINLYLHPYLIQLTSDNALWMLLIMVGIAAILVPAHHRLEKWATTKLVEKNKKIRLEAAKKTIARLETETKPEGQPR